MKFKSLATTARHKFPSAASIQLYLDIALKLVSISAIVVTGCWAYYRFDLSGNDDWVVNMRMRSEVLPYNENSRLLVVHLDATNPTTTTVNVERGKGGFKITLRKIPSDRKPGAVLDDDTSSEIIAERNLLATDVELLPNATFGYTEGFVVPLGQEVYIEAVMERSNGNSKKNDSENSDFVTANDIVNIVDPR